MTCIVGLVQDSRIFIGADSAGVNSSTLEVRARKDLKVFKNGPFIMGFTSSFRMGQLLRYSFKPTPKPKNMSDDKFMVTLFIDQVRKCLKKGGYAHMRNEVEGGGTFLVGFNGTLYTIESDYQVAQVEEDYTAIGCGEPFALGALFATDPEKQIQIDTYLQPEERVDLALSAAASFSGGVTRPFHILYQ